MKSVFKIGDRARLTTHFNNLAWPIGYEFEVTNIQHSVDHMAQVCKSTLHGLTKSGQPGSVPAEGCELINTKQEKQMLNFHVLNDTIVLNYGGKTVNIASDDSRYADVLNCIRKGELDRIPELVEIERAFAGSGVELRDGLLWEGENPFPAELSQRILKFKDQKLPYKPLLKFWDNLKKNPSFNSRKMMFAFLEHNGHPLTQDGCFIAYRGVTEDFKDKHSKTFNNAPGSICEMPRDLVDDNPNQTCSHGLHVACFDYAKGFGEKLVEVKVNPADVVCVPVDYNGTKMRVCKFEVIQECAAILDRLVYDDAKEEEHDEVEEAFEELEEECEECEEGPSWVDVGDDEDRQDHRECEFVDDSGLDELEPAVAPNYRHAKRDKNGKFVSKKKRKKSK